MTTFAPTKLVSVLVVDDTATMRQLLRYYLRASGRFDVIGEAVDGRDGIEQATLQQPDIILLDLAMPIMDGFEAIEPLTRCSPRSLIIVLSGFDAETNAARSIALGAHGYIEKKHRPDELMRRITDVWESAASAAAVAAAAVVADKAAIVERTAEAVHSQFRLAFEHAPIGTALVTVEGRFAEVNEAFSWITGHRECDLLGRRLADITHADDLDADAVLAARLMSGEIASYQWEKRIVRADGGVVWILLSRSLFAPGGGQCPSSVIQIVDITGQKSLAWELEAANAELARSNADLSDFAAVAAHDLKSPLHVILGFGELLVASHGGQLDDQGRELLASVVSGARRMEELIEALLAYCRVGSADRVATETDLNSVVASVQAVLEPEIKAVHATITSDLLPRVIGDPVQLRGLFQNLIANALTFTRGGVPPVVHVSAQWHDDGWLISVADNGIGIDDAQRERIFGMFTRLHPQDRFGGTGIGLAICQRIVEGHGGRIWVEDNPAGGSRFLFRLPERLGLTRSHGDSTGAVDTVGSRPLEILLVEDSREHTKLIAALLLAAPVPGYHLRSAATVGDALATMRTSDVDCVLLDLSLPDADELEALAQVRAAEPLLAVVIITSSSDEALAFAAVREGAQDYLIKGRIDADQLSRSIRWAVQRKALETELAREALHDPLTKLPNRTLLLDRLRSALARAERSGEALALLYLDLDDFKPINDTFGHEVGDHVLAAVANRLRDNLRPQDTAARLGGDEFVVLCEGFEDAGSEVEAVRARLEWAVAKPMTICGHAMHLQASIGTATSGPADAPDAILRRADAAMYKAKQARRR